MYPKCVSWRRSSSKRNRRNRNWCRRRYRNQSKLGEWLVEQSRVRESSQGAKLSSTIFNKEINLHILIFHNFFLHTKTRTIIFPMLNMRWNFRWSSKVNRPRLSMHPRIERISLQFGAMQKKNAA